MTSRPDPLRVAVSVPYSWAFENPGSERGDARVRVIPRSSDWGLSKVRSLVRHCREAVRTAWAARGCDVLVVSTIGAEVALYGTLARLVTPRARVVALDVLAPRREMPRGYGWWLARAVQQFLVIRTGDAAMLGERFGVTGEKCTFVYWPVQAPSRPASESEDFVYAAGWAHRDWQTMAAALELSGVHAVLAPGRPLELSEELADRVQVIDMPPPSEGRGYTRRCRFMVLPLVDTTLPSGPLVLLDAMASGKAVIASAVNGTRDYVQDGATGILVPPGDPEALADAIARLDRDPELRRQLGDTARAFTLRECSVPAFWSRVVQECESLVGRLPTPAD